MQYLRHIKHRFQKCNNLKFAVVLFLSAKVLWLSTRYFIYLPVLLYFATVLLIREMGYIYKHAKSVLLLLSHSDKVLARTPHKAIKRKKIQANIWENVCQIPLFMSVWEKPIVLLLHQPRKEQQNLPSNGLTNASMTTVLESLPLLNRTHHTLWGRVQMRREKRENCQGNHVDG